jgi:hypothetical protein
MLMQQLKGTPMKRENLVTESVVSIEECVQRVADQLDNLNVKLSTLNDLTKENGKYYGVDGDWVDKDQYVEPAVVAQLHKVIDDLAHTTRMLGAQHEERDFKDINRAINSLKWTVILALIPILYTLVLILKKL